MLSCVLFRMGTHFFEGAEKLLEVWLTSADETADLRVVSRYEIADHSGT
jgi:hypothetical protein